MRSKGGLLGLWLFGLGACGGDDGRAAGDAAAGENDAGDGEASVAPCQPDESAPVPSRESYGNWLKVELEGTQCSDGSQYKFFVNYAEQSNNLVIIFEPGGACWDYESCSGMGLRGAANPNGIPDNHMDEKQHMHPHAGGFFGADGAFAGWNKVFIPYCTGDVHSGSRVATYESPDGSETLTYRHLGHDNMLVVSQWLDETFTDIPRMVVTGCSAGGAGATLNYHLLRSRVQGAQCGYLLNDSGPLFQAGGPSSAVQEQTQAAYDSDKVLEKLASELGDEAVSALEADFGNINTVLADAYPQDRFAITVYQRDLNYSLYSYDTFYDHPPYESIVEMWEQDLTALVEQYDTRANMAYFMPFYRQDNCSHCVSIIPVDQIDALLSGEVSPWQGTEIQESEVNLSDFIDHLLDDPTPLKSYFEQEHSDGEHDEAAVAACRD